MAKSMQRRIELLSKVSALVGTVDLERAAGGDRPAVDPRARRLVVGRHPRRGVAPGLRRASRSGKIGGRRAAAAVRAVARPARLERPRRGTLALLPRGHRGDPAANTRQSPEQLAVLRELGLCSALAVPLRLGGETIAVMSFATTKTTGRRYTRDDLALAEELARRAVALLERARLYADLKTSEARLSRRRGDGARRPLRARSAAALSLVSTTSASTARRSARRTRSCSAGARRAAHRRQAARPRQRRAGQRQDPPGRRR